MNIMMKINANSITTNKNEYKYFLKSWGNENCC